MEGEEHESVTEGKEKLQKKVANLIKKQNLRAVRRIVGGQDAFKPWGQDAKAKVRLYSSRKLIIWLYRCTEFLNVAYLSGWKPSD